jgi:hypothetical protein
MWVFTQHGFLSIVQSREDPKVVMVRARDRKSLEQFRQASTEASVVPEVIEALPILESKGTDYRYRIICHRDVVARYLAAEAKTIDYPNFKDRVTKTRGNQWHDVLLGIWSRVHDLSDWPKGYRSPFSTLHQSPFVGGSWVCEGTTKKDKRCTHEARIGYKTCWQHASQEAGIRHQGSQGRLTDGSPAGRL